MSSHRPGPDPVPDPIVAIAEHSPFSIHFKDRDRRYVYVNPAFERLYRTSLPELIAGGPDAVHPPVVADAIRDRDEQVLREECTVEFEHFVSTDEGLKALLVYKFPVRNGSGEVVGLGGIGIEVTERARADMLRRSDERYRSLFDQAPISIWEEDWAEAKELVDRLKSNGVVDVETHLLNQPELLERIAWEVVVVDFNDATVDTYRAPDKASFWPIAIQNFATTSHWDAFRQSVSAFARGETKVVVQAWEKTYDGGDIFVRDTLFIPPRYRDDWARVVRVVEDITEAHTLAAQLSHQASHDELTGLINRRAFEDRLSRVLKTRDDDESEHALCYLDLDRFKLINDTCGHVAGDQLLRELGSLLKRKVRRRDSLARLGGDEFGLLMEHCGLDQAQRVAELLREAIVEFRFKWDEQLHQIGVSVGLVSIRGDMRSVTDVLSAADAACYSAKDKGRNRIEVYDRSDHAMVRHDGDMRWVQRITEGLEDNRFRLYFQPIVSLNGSITGRHLELLLRLADDNGPDIGPETFLPAVERYGMKRQLDRWVLEETLTWLEAEHEAQAIELCGVNVSPQSLTDEGFQSYLGSRLAGNPTVAGKLCLEIAETALISDLSFAADFVNALRRHGCRFALDDFGSGVSSFAHLKSLPVDFVKIDGSFVRNILDSETDLAVVATVNDLAHRLGCQTIAEFAETDEIVDRLRDLGVDFVQGLASGGPRPLSELAWPQ